MAEGDEVLHRAAGGRDVVDVDTRDREVGKGPLEHDREPVTDQAQKRLVVDARPGDDHAVGVLFSKRRVVRLARPVVREWLEHHPEAARPRRVREAAQGVGEERIAGDLLRRLEHHEGEHPADPSGELASRRMRVITELAGRIQDAAACLAGGS